jgi:hypothetical protein
MYIPGMRRTLCLVLSWATIACGGAPSSSLLDGGTGPDGASDTGTSDTGANCDISACATIPMGFSVVSLSTSACAGGWTSTAVVSAPAAGTGTCTCACNVTGQPDCTTGMIDRFLDDDTSPMCNETATTLEANGGVCTNIGAYIQFDHGHYAVDAPPPTGGTCEYDAHTDTTMVTSTPGQLCAPPASCPGAICGTGNVCVSQSGDVACPSGFPTKTLVGTSATAMCSACPSSCTVTGTCTGTLSFYPYTDPTCSTTPVSFTADGSCVADPTSDTTAYYQYYQYTGMVASATCNGTPPMSMATATLNGPTTVCCQH